MSPAGTAQPIKLLPTPAARKHVPLLPATTPPVTPAYSTTQHTGKAQHDFAGVELVNGAGGEYKQRVEQDTA
jgi:hypothetical protein